jgi:hypothetical protein
LDVPVYVPVDEASGQRNGKWFVVRVEVILFTLGWTSISLVELVPVFAYLIVPRLV